MKESTLLKIVNPLLGILILTQILSALLKHEIGRTAFKLIHEQGGYVLIIFIIAHVLLNRKWVYNTYFRKKA